MSIGSMDAREKADALCSYGFSLMGASRLKGRGDDKKALVAFEEAVSICPTHAPAWNMLGRLYGNIGRLEQAQNAFARAIDGARDDGERARGLEGMARVLGDKHDISGARDHFRRALELFQKADEHERVVEVQLSLANMARQQSNAAELEALAASARSVAARNNNLAGESDALGLLIEAAMSKQKWREAREMLQRSLAIHESLGLTARQAGDLFNLGTCAANFDDIDGCRRLWRRAHDLFQEAGDMRGAAYVREHLG